MRVLIMTTDYPAFLDQFYASDSSLAQASYDEQMCQRNDTLFANADFYSRGLAANGAVAADIYMNNEILQRRWAQENGVRLPTRPPWIRSIAVRTPLRRFLPASPAVPDWVVPILAAQIEAFRPDVIVNADVHFLTPEILRAIAGSARLIVAQTNTFLVPQLNYGAYDLVLTAFPSYVRDFNSKGVRARLSRLAFDPAALAHVRAASRTVPIAFVGSFGSLHAERRAVLEHLCERVEVAVWGPNAEELPAASAIRRRHRGHAWGREMFQIFAESEIVLNHEHAISYPYAANMRFYEATGCGALLLTNRRDLSGMFEPENEVAIYDDPEDCLRRIEELRGDPARCRALAEAGQNRTLREHTYVARAGEMIGFFEELSAQARPARGAAVLR
jgi:spore maturation protein CgeB